MSADDWSVVDPSACGRHSVRIYMQNAYDEAMVVLNLERMPASCVTLPGEFGVAS